MPYAGGRLGYHEILAPIGAAEDSMSNVMPHQTSGPVVGLLRITGALVAHG